MSNAKAALIWITDLLNELNVPFQIQGGLAAKAYGAKRDLVDIDIDIPYEGFNKIVDRVRPHIIYGPSQYKDDNWDLYLMTLSYEGQEIDLTDGKHVKVYNSITNEWIDFATDFSNSCYLDALGVKVPVIPRKDLIAYKKIVGRPVDLSDIQEIDEKSQSG
ncbi:MAG: hypothetical protein JSS07_04515 [Proteobacteria bacterium]|nr:hypothetical protein [Pseudomonadota bacterium]